MTVLAHRPHPVLIGDMMAGSRTRPAAPAPLDSETVEAARVGDRQAWSVVILRYNTLILSIFLGFAIARPRSMELSQDLWLKLYLRARKGLLKILTLPGLAVREARFRALDELRGNKRAGPTADLEDVVLEAPSPTAEEQISRQKDLALARRMLRALPARQRQVIVLAGIRGKPHAEVAEELGISTVRAKQTLSDARQRLRRIRAMPPDVQSTYLLVAADGLTADAAAEQQGVSRDVVQERLLVAKQHIQHGGPQ
jgi:RNA polymerase sigma factor (sigma-70 family)